MIDQLLWIPLAALTGFGIAVIFAGWLKLPRDRYLLVYIPAVAAFFILFVVRNDVGIHTLLIKNWGWGLLGAAIAGFVVLRNVLSQPASERNTGLGLIKDIVWPGFAYGLVDALLLSVLPILAVYTAMAQVEWAGSWWGNIALGLIALFASMVVTAVYHLGYPEYRNSKVWWTMFGNGILSLAYLLTMNPLAAVLPHIAMHITAMIHGRETTGQVPPHYDAA